MDIKRAIKDRALALGFDLLGIAPLPSTADREFYRQWLEKGYGGEMRYLANPKRDDLRQVLPSVKSIICVGLIYNAPYAYSTEVSAFPSIKARGQKTPSPQAALPQGANESSGFRLRDAAQCLPGRAKENLLTPRSLGGEGVEVRGVPQPNKKLEIDGMTATDAGPRGWISRYGWGRDYHEITREKLEQLRSGIAEWVPGAETRVYVDTGPLAERTVARLSGIGWMGKNTCLISQQKGSWFFLGVILTNIALAADVPAPDRCGSCTRCLDACPTGALVEPYVMDASRCIAYFNIELKGPIPEEYREALGANVFGCDICQDVCPWNNRALSVGGGPPGGAQEDASLGARQKAAATTTLPEFQPRQIEISRRALQKPEAVSSSQPPAHEDFSLFHPSLEALASLSHDDFRRLFAYSPIKRVKFRGWIRNLCVAMGNSGDRRFVPWLERIGRHEDAMLREHAEWALKRLA